MTIPEKHKYLWENYPNHRCAECSKSVQPQKVTRALAKQLAKMQKDQDAIAELENFFQAENPINHEEIRDQIRNWNKKHSTKLFVDETFQMRLNGFLQKKIPTEKSSIIYMQKFKKFLFQTFPFTSEVIFSLINNPKNPLKIIYDSINSKPNKEKLSKILKSIKESKLIGENCSDRLIDNLIALGFSAEAIFSGLNRELTKVKRALERSGEEILEAVGSTNSDTMIIDKQASPSETNSMIDYKNHARDLGNLQVMLIGLFDFVSDAQDKSTHKNLLIPIYRSFFRSLEINTEQLVELHQIYKQGFLSKLYHPLCLPFINNVQEQQATTKSFCAEKLKTLIKNLLPLSNLEHNQNLIWRAFETLNEIDKKSAQELAKDRIQDPSIKLTRLIRHKIFSILLSNPENSTFIIDLLSPSPHQKKNFIAFMANFNKANRSIVKSILENPNLDFKKFYRVFSNEFLDSNPTKLDYLINIDTENKIRYRIYELYESNPDLIPKLEELDQNSPFRKWLESLIQEPENGHD